MNLDFYFPTPIWWEKTEIPTKDLISLCYRLREEDTLGRIVSNQGGWQSQSFFIGTHVEMKQLENKIIQAANQCFLDFGYREDLYVVNIDSYWFNINGKNNSNMSHIHPCSFLSGVFYLKSQPKNGNINFLKDFDKDYIVTSQATIDQYTILSASAICFEPENQKLIMFPSWLPHSVDKNELDEDRISISFNTKIYAKEFDKA